MNVLFDQGTPVPLRRRLVGHRIETVYERGWATLRNGLLLSATEAAGFDVKVTTDRQLRYQQNLSGRRLAILVLGTTSWPRIQQCIQQYVADIQSALDTMSAGNYRELPCDPVP